MKFTTLTFIITVSVKALTLSAAESQPEKVDIAVIGGGIGGLTVAYNLLKSSKNVVVFTQHLGGPVLKGVFPENWRSRSSWRHHYTEKQLASSFGCSVKDVNSSATIKDIQCLIQGLIKGLGPDRLRENYKLVEIDTNSASEAPVRLVFLDTQKNELRTVFANGVELAIHAHDESQIKSAK